jgi:Na+-transporting methylmalonyl-CoA/oxaloacetate decarboxylase beta subunit
MTDAVTIEREKTAELNEKRASEETGSGKIETSVGSGPNTGEYLIFLGIGAVLDLSGLLSDLSLVFAIPLRIITIFPTLAFLLWRLMKGGKKIYPVGLAIMGGAETILSFLPAYTGFVVYAWFKESKIGKSTIGKLAKIKT